MAGNVESSITLLLLTTASVASLVGVVFWHTIRASLSSEPDAQQASSNVLTAEESNLRDQYGYTAKGESPDSWKVRSLWIFPIKSCHGIELKESRVVSTGWVTLQSLVAIEGPSDYMATAWNTTVNTPLLKRN